MTNTTSNTRLRNAGGNWILGTVDGLEVQAKAYDEPSQYGMEQDGRISKLWVKTPSDTGLGIVIYNYDRGLGIDYIKPEALDMIVAEVVKHI